MRERGRISHSGAVSSALLTVSAMGHRAWARNVGLFTDLRGKKRFIGIKGEADVQGILRGGWALAIEVKTGRAVRTPEQIAWGRMWTGLDGCYVVARYSDCDDGDAMIKAVIESYLAERGPGGAA